MHDNWQFGVTIAAIIAGIFFNQRAADSVRSDLTGQINTLSGRIDMVIGKLLELAERHEK